MVRRRRPEKVLFSPESFYYIVGSFDLDVKENPIACHHFHPRHMQL